MKVVEKFSTLQGEGKYLGVPSYFIRTTGCNLRCEWKNKDGTITKCDTPYTSWSPEKGTTLSIDELLKELYSLKVKHVVITGGEPTIQPDIVEVVKELVNKKYFVTIETNGTKFRKIPGAFLSISPKLNNSIPKSNGYEKQLHVSNNRLLFHEIKLWTKHNDYQLKFVYNTVDDLKEIFHLQVSLDIPSEKIYLMPQGITTEQFREKAKEMFEVCKRFKYNYTPRLHIDVYGNIRGV